MASREDERSSSPGRTFDVDQFLNLEGDNGKKATEAEEVSSAHGARTNSEGSEQQIEGSFEDEGTSSRLNVRGRPVTAEIGPSTVSDEFLRSYPQGFFPEGCARASDGSKTVPVPREDEVVVFLDFFKAGLRFPCEPSFGEF